MKLTLNASVRSELFDIQKTLVKAISLAAGGIVFLAGAVLQLLNPTDTMGMSHRVFFVFLFGLTALIASRKKIHYRIIESCLAITGALFLSRMLFQYYGSGLAPIHIVVVLLASVGLSGVFIYKTSLVMINLPSLFFLFYAAAHPPIHQTMPIYTSFVHLVSAAIVGYFLTWQKVYLINKSLALEIHKNTVINNLQEGVMLLDSEGNAVTMNEAICNITGLNRDEIADRANLSKNWQPLEADSKTPLATQRFPSLIALSTGKTVKDFPMAIRRAENKISYLEVTANPIMSQSEPEKVEFVLVTTRDVSELKKAQEVIENQKLQTLANSKLTALGEMAAGIAHEINNPLTIILGRVEHMQRLVKSGNASEADVMQSLDKILKTTFRISKIVKSMKSLSREHEGDDLVRSNLKEIIDDILNISSDHFSKNEVEMISNIDSTIELDCNPGLLSQVFMNLLSNSIDAIKNQTNDRWVRLDAQTLNDTLHITFSDSGPGIPTTIQEKIMLPFFTTKEAGKGTGIGLSLCRTIIDNHNGKIYIDETAQTTTFKIELPLKQTKTSRFKSA
ncbi:MAG: GHKL domain-containing protein [Bdellovibrionaceae bacterium]|nr:GHKL domain-containing protein [Pseudobdellovibrionaceae bacterium]